jgi:hypothetical protein
VKLPDAKNLFAKKFACSTTIVKGANKDPDVIDIQGDVIDGLIEFLNEKWQISEDSIIVEEEKKPPKPQPPALGVGKKSKSKKDESSDDDDD